MKITPHFRASLALFLTVPAASARIEPPVLMFHPDAIMPLELQDSRLKDPRATVRVMVSAQGNVADAVCIEASHHLMARRAESIARDCVFRPAEDDGMAIAIRYDVNINFEYAHSASSITTGVEDMAGRIRNSTDKSEALVFARTTDLDAPLNVIDRPPPVLVRDEDGAIHYGKAVVEGYVDLRGNFRFLHVIEADNKYIAEAAIENFSKIRFNPPLYKGGPATAKIRIPFIARPP